MKLKFLKIDVENNTIEANWYEDILGVDGEVISTQSVKCENYSNKNKFMSEVEGAEKYVGLIEWASDEPTQE